MVLMKATTTFIVNVPGGASVEDCYLMLKLDIDVIE